MTGDTVALLSLAQWGIAGLSKVHETVSGDAHVLVPNSHGFLAAVVDGLGHGPEAAEAAERATATLHAYPDDSVTQLMRRCHQNLRVTRGAVLSLASIAENDSTMTWLGVGNVEGALFRATRTVQEREHLLLRGGVVGYELPPMHEVVLPIFYGDVLVFVTDGISSGFTELSPLGCPPQDYADAVLSRWKRAYDDALVLAVRYTGGRSSTE